MRGTIRKLGIEGGLWALVTDAGETVELLDAPEALRRDGLRAEVEGARDAGAEVTIGMVGDVIRVTGWRPID
ncbi:MAG: hypothetical protein KF901_10325 [Myxococcales bacterium]|nr:hypothetical protein [Myxococcales bacterium]